MNEPLFRLINSDDPGFREAHARAAASIGRFERIVRRASGPNCLAKLRFRDPDLSSTVGEDQFLFIWLTDVVYDEDDGMFGGEFFEVPAALRKWHKVGERLWFEPDDVFDWMAVDNGHILGGFTIRVIRDRLSSEERSRYDAYIGATSFEPIANGASD